MQADIDAKLHALSNLDDSNKVEKKESIALAVNKEESKSIVKESPVIISDSLKQVVENSYKSDSKEELVKKVDFYVSYIKSVQAQIKQDLDRRLYDEGSNDSRVLQDLISQTQLSAVAPKKEKVADLIKISEKFSSFDDAHDNVTFENKETAKDLTFNNAKTDIVKPSFNNNTASSINFANENADINARVHIDIDEVMPTEDDALLSSVKNEFAPKKPLTTTELDRLDKAILEDENALDENDKVVENLLFKNNRAQNLNSPISVAPNAIVDTDAKNEVSHNTAFFNDGTKALQDFANLILEHQFTINNATSIKKESNVYSYNTNAFVIPNDKLQNFGIVPFNNLPENNANDFNIIQDKFRFVKTTDESNTTIISKNLIKNSVKANKNINANVNSETFVSIASHEIPDQEPSFINEPEGYNEAIPVYDEASFAGNNEIDSRPNYEDIPFDDSISYEDVGDNEDEYKDVTSSEMLSYGADHSDTAIVDGDPNNVPEIKRERIIANSQNIEFPGKKRIEVIDFYEQLEKIDPWYADLKKVTLGPDVFSALCYCSRDIDPTDKSKWYLHLTKECKSLLDFKEFVPNLEEAFSKLYGYKITIVINLEDKVLDSWPSERVKQLYMQSLSQAREEIKQSPKIMDLLESIGEDINFIPILMYKDK